MFKKILVPVDGSETAWRALNNALEIGKKFESEILVVNVIQPYNNAALLAVPLDHATINQGNSELEKSVIRFWNWPKKWSAPIRIKLNMIWK